MKHKIIAGAAAAALALSLSACGGGGSDAASGDGTIASSFIFGGPAEFKTRTDGIPGLADNYGVSFGKYTVTDTGGPVTVNALKQGQIDAADLFTTDPSIEANGFVILADPKANFAAQNVLPIITKDKATDGVKTTLNAISTKLDTAGLGALMVKVVTEKQDPADVAKAWLADQGLDASGTSASDAKLTVGSANFPENVLLAQIYAKALEAQGADIKLKLNIGSREKYVPALKDGSVDLMPEYNGSILAYLDPKATATAPDDVFAALQKVLPSNLIVLDQAEAQDSDAIVVTKETAAKYNLKSIEDLAKKQ